MRLLAAILISTLALSLTGCGQQNDSGPDQQVKPEAAPAERPEAKFKIARQQVRNQLQGVGVITANYLHITSANDAATVVGLVVNRGNCSDGPHEVDVFSEDKPWTPGFGDVRRVLLNCVPIEAIVYTTEYEPFTVTWGD